MRSSSWSKRGSAGREQRKSRERAAHQVQVVVLDDVPNALLDARRLLEPVLGHKERRERPEQGVGQGEDVRAGRCQQTATHLVRRSDRSVCIVARRGGPMAGPPSPSPSTLFSPSITRRGLPCESELWSPLPLVSCFSSSESPLPSSRRIVARFPTRGRPSPFSLAGVADMTSGAAADDRGSRAGRGEALRRGWECARRGGRGGGRACAAKGSGLVVVRCAGARTVGTIHAAGLGGATQKPPPCPAKRISPLNHPEAGSRE